MTILSIALSALLLMNAYQDMIQGSYFMGTIAGLLACAVIVNYLFNITGRE